MRSKIAIFLVLISSFSVAQTSRCARLVANLQNSSDSEVDLGSRVGIEQLEGPSISFWSVVDSRVQEDSLMAQLDPNNPMILGRMGGNQVPPYGDPLFRSSTIAPNGRSILTGGDRDITLSRWHCMLRSGANGSIEIVNGAPARGGGLRAPTNGTYLMEPGYRPMRPGEVFVIEKGSRAKIRLPNGTVLLISASE